LKGFKLFSNRGRVLSVYQKLKPRSGTKKRCCLTTTDRTQ